MIFFQNSINIFYSQKKFLGFVFLLCILVVPTIFSQDNNDNPRILIIVCCNKNDPIDQFLNTLSNQTISYQTQIALILQDNEDINEIPLSISEYQALFQNISIYKTQEKNSSQIINKIIDKSQSEFIMILSPNDRLFPNALRKYLLTFERNPKIDILYADCYTSYQNTYWDNDIQNYWYLVEYPSANLHESFFNIAGSHCMWRSSIHQKIGCFNDQFTYLYTFELLNRAISQQIRYKKINGISGTVYCNYKDQPSPFKNFADIQTYYQEYSMLQDLYKNSIQPTNATSSEEKPFVIITPSYNNRNWYQFNLDSLLGQSYKNFRIIYINDHSHDETAQLVKAYLTTNDRENKVTFIDNEYRCGALANIYNAIHSCHADEIILLVDGDDWLAHPYVLKYLNKIYQDSTVWMTYGQFIWFPQLIPGSAQNIAQEIINNNGFRESAWASTHLRTFYAGLFQKIHKEDLHDKHGEFFSMAWDLAIMFPMLEMAGNHSHFIPDILYIYNTANSISDHKVNLDLQQKLAHYISNKKKYEPLLSLF